MVTMVFAVKLFFNFRDKGSIKYSLIGATNGPENKKIAVDDDDKRNEEHKGEKQHSVSSHGGCECHIIPGARGQQPFRNISACKTEKDRKNNTVLNISQ